MCAEQVHGPRAEKPPAATPSETRLRGYSVASSVASEPRSRSSSLNSTDSGSGLQAAPELGRGGPLTSKRFSVISSEDFDQELVVKPLRVKKKKRTKKTGTVRGRAPGAPSRHVGPLTSLGSGAARREHRQQCLSSSEEFHCESFIQYLTQSVILLMLKLKIWFIHVYHLLDQRVYELRRKAVGIFRCITLCLVLGMSSDTGFFFFFWPCCRACEILVPQPRYEPMSLAVSLQSPND